MKGLTLLAMWIMHITGVSCTMQLCEKQQYIEFEQKSTIRCSFEKGFDGVYWYATNESTTEEPLMKLEHHTKGGGGYATGVYDLAPDGSLIIKHASFQDEHIYRVVVRYIDPLKIVSDDVNVHVIVIPDPPEIIVEGCQHLEYCLLPPESLRNVSCSVKGIRPVVELEWVQSNETSSNAISLKEHRTTVSQNGYTYNITLIAKLHITGNVKHFTLQCKVTEKYFTIFNLQTTVGIITVDERKEMSDETRKLWFLSFFIFIVPVLLVLLWAFRKGNGKRGTDDNAKSTVEENVPMANQDSRDDSVTDLWHNKQSYSRMYTVDEVHHDSAPKLSSNPEEVEASDVPNVIEKK